MMSRKLPEVCEIQYGFPFDSSLFSAEGDLPLIRIRDVVRGYTETYTSEKCDVAYLVHEGNILVGMDGVFNVAKWKGEPAYLNQRVCRIIPNETIDADFLFYFIPTALKKIENETAFVTVKHLKAKQLNAVVVPDVPIEEQKKIAAQLNVITHLISLRQQQAEKLDELVKARFVEMFGDPCEMLHWECKKIEEVADVTVGVVVKPANFYTDDRLHGVKAFRSLNIGEMKVKDNDWVYFSEEGNAQNAKSQLHEGDVLVVRSGAPGTSCVVTKAYEGCNAIDVIIVHVDGIKLNPYYLCAFNNFPHGMRQMLKGVGGAAQKHLNVGKYNQMIVAIPPMKLQNEFVLFMDSVDCEKDRIQRSAALLKTLKRSLMQQYFG